MSMNILSLTLSFCDHTVRSTKGKGTLVFLQRIRFELVADGCAPKMIVIEGILPGA
ncbi:hypothetical protein D3C75_358850 [compost metagenome]